MDNKTATYIKTIIWYYFYPGRNSDGSECLSQREYDVTNFGRKKIIATNGVSIPELRKTSFRKTGLKLIFIGRLDAYHKGLDILLEAVRNIKDKMKETGATLDIYGPDYAGRYAHIESLIAENNVGDVVTLHPAVSGKEKEQILLDSDVFVQTSRFEGMPLGILEALSYGLPCLVSEGNGFFSQLCAYDKNNNRIFKYSFSEYYINAVAINSDGSGCVACGVTSDNGGMRTGVYVLDFGKEEPVSKYVIDDDTIIDCRYISGSRRASRSPTIALIPQPRLSRLRFQKAVTAEAARS